MAHPTIHHVVVPPVARLDLSGVHFNRSVESLPTEQSHYCGQGRRRGHGAPPRGVQKRGPRHRTGSDISVVVVLVLMGGGGCGFDHR